MGAQSKIDLARPRKYLAQFRAKRLPHLIDGQARYRGYAVRDAIACRSPAVLAQVHAGTPSVIDRAAKSSAQAFKSWGKTSGDKRRAILHKIADAIEARADEIAAVECMDTGQPIRYMSKAALRGAENFRFFADRAPGAADGVSLPTAASCELHDAPADRSRGAS